MFYRFHVEDKIYFKNDIKVTLQAMGGGPAERVKEVMQNGAPCIPVTADDGNVRHIYKEENAELSRRKVIRTRLKRHNFGIFRLVVFERRQPFGILRTKIYSKFCPF